jgi:hypothetical protein
VLAEIDRSTVNGWAGRQLPRLFTDAGLGEVRVHGELVLVGHAFLERIYRPVLGRLADADPRLAGRLDEWAAGLRADDAAGRFLAAAPAVIAAATR